jgi:acetyl esterase
VPEHRRKREAMMDESTWDPEMLAFQKDFAAAAAALPAIELRRPFDPQRLINDSLALRNAAGGPDLAEVTDRWVFGFGRRIFCRVYKPAVAAGLPVMVYFHGGGWVWASVDTHDRLCREYAAASGCAVVSVDYALSPEAVFPQAIEECAAVVRWLGAHGAEWGLDPARIVLGGVLALYPVCDANFETGSYKQFGSGGYFLTLEKMRFYWSVYAPDDAMRLHPLASPLRADLRGLPPVMVQLAELDVLRDEGIALTEKLRAAGVETTYELVAGVIHGYLRASGKVSKARAAIASGGSWIKQVVSP